MMKIKNVLILAIFVLCCCDSGLEGEIPGIKATIEKYDRQLAEGYMKMDMSSLREMITPEHGFKLDHRLEAFKMARRRLETELKNIEFLEIQAVPGKRGSGKTAKVRTKEIWDARHVDMNTKKIIKDTKSLSYVLSYELVKSEDQWRVDSVTVLEEKLPDR